MAAWPQAAPPLVQLSDERKVELTELWASIRKRKWAILALAVVVGAVAGVISSAQVPVYRSSAKVLIEPDRRKGAGDGQAFIPTRDSFSTQVELLRSRDLAERTAKALKIWEHPMYDPRIARPDWKQKLMTSLGITAAAKPAELAEESLIAIGAGQIAGGLSVTPLGQTEILIVGFSSRDAQFAAKVVNALVDIYVEMDRENLNRGAVDAAQQLQMQVAEVRGDLKQAEDALQTFRERLGVVQVGPSVQGPAVQAVNSSMASLQEAKARRIALEAEYQQAKAAGTDYNAIPALTRNPAVMDARRAVAAAEARLANLLLTLSRESDRVQLAETQLKQLKDTLAKAQGDALAVMFKEYENARAIEQALSAAAGAARQGAFSFNRQEFELSLLERNYQATRQLYDSLILRLRDVNISTNFQRPAARVIDKALPNYSSGISDRNQDILRAFVAALLLGSIASILLDRLDNTVKDGDDAEQKLRVPLLGALPAVSERDAKAMVSLVLTDGQSHFAEGIRTARTGVMLSNLDSPRQTLLITSSLPNEGKTTVAVNLALAHAQSKRTLLIDADMRRSQVGSTLNVSRAGKGLTGLLAGTATAEECMSSIPGSTLQILTVGELPPNPLELLLSNRFREVLDELSHQFEVIVIDSPPVELVSEALVLAPLVTSIALVVRAESTPAPLARKSMTRLQRAGGRVLGTIVNQMNFERSQRYYGKYGDGTYSYGTYGKLPDVMENAAARSPGTG